jgi:hypothetical protein
VIRAGIVAVTLAAGALSVPAASAQTNTIVCGQSGKLTCTLTQPRCHSGGKFGGGYETFTAALIERGRSGVTRMKQRAQAQALIGGVWRDETPIVVRYSTRFADTAADHTFTFHWRADFPANTAGHDQRIVWQGVWLPLDRRTPVYEQLCPA